MTETNGEIKPMPVPFEENAYKYADKQAELYRGLKEPSGGYANIVDAYIAGATKETALLSQHILDLQKDKGNLTDKVRELEQQIEKMKTELFAAYGRLSLAKALLTQWLHGGDSNINIVSDTQRFLEVESEKVQG